MNRGELEIALDRRDESETIGGIAPLRRRQVCKRKSTIRIKERERKSYKVSERERNLAVIMVR